MKPTIAKKIRIKMAILNINKSQIGVVLGATRQAVSQAFKEENAVPKLEQKIIELFKKPIEELEKIFRGE